MIKHHIGRTLLGTYFVHLGTGEKLGATASALHCRSGDLVHENEAELRKRWPAASPGITPCGAVGCTCAQG